MSVAVRTDTAYRAEAESRLIFSRNRTRERDRLISLPEKEKNFDRVILQDREPMDDESFARVLSKSTVEAMKEEVPEKYLAELHKQVQAGEYVPNASRIAERLLGYAV